MGLPLLHLDISRLTRRYENYGGPTGIDRVDLTYARWALVQQTFALQPVTRSRSGLLALDTAALGTIVAELERRWEADVPPGFGREDRGALKYYAERARSRLARWRLTAGAKPLESASRPSVYLNVGQDGLDTPQNYAALSCPKVALIHDVIPLTHPEYDTVRSTLLHKKRIEAVAAHMDHVIANSAATLADLRVFTGEAPYGETVAHLAPALAPPPAPARYDVPTFVHVSTINRRKNLALLLQIWREFAKHPNPPHLAVVGRRGNDETALELIDRCEAIKPLVTVHGALNDSETAPIVAGATALLTPSFAEGYGLPIAEAHVMGVPVIASDLPAHREVGGEGALYCSPLDGAAWREAILAFARDEPIAAKTRAAIKVPKDWDTHFSIVAPLLESLSQP